MDPALRNVMSTDLLFNIFSKFSFEQKLESAQVCHIWKDVVYHNSMWRNIKINIKDDIDEDSVDKMLPVLIKRNISSVGCSFSAQPNSAVRFHNLDKFMRGMISLKSIEFYIAREADDILPEIFLSPMPNLIEVKISGYPIWKTINNCVSRYRNIESLTIDRLNSDSDGEYLLRKIATNLLKLRSLSLEFGFYLTDIGIGYLTGCIASDSQNVHSAHPQVERLKLGWCQVSDQGLQYISSGFQSFKQLELRSDYITNRGMGYLANMKCLQELGLYECRNVNDDFLKLLANAGSRITCLKLQGGQFGNRALEYIGQSQLPLEKLYMRWWQITDEGVRHFVKHEQSIKQLTLEYCNYITEKSLEIIAENFPSLRYLNVLRCDKITQKGLENIRKLRRNLQVDSRYNWQAHFHTLLKEQ